MLRLPMPVCRAQAPPQWVPFKERARPQGVENLMAIDLCVQGPHVSKNNRHSWEGTLVDKQALGSEIPCAPRKAGR